MIVDYRAGGRAKRFAKSGAGKVPEPKTTPFTETSAAPAADPCQPETSRDPRGKSIRACRRLESNLDMVPCRLRDLQLKVPGIRIVIGHEGNESELTFTFRMTSWRGILG